MEIAQALFECGRIYRFGLERENLSEQSYINLLERYPKTNLRLEALYALYILNQSKNMGVAESYKETIIGDYPDSLIAKLLINPDYLIEKEQRNQALQLIYADAYEMYESGNYVEADQVIKKALKDFEDVDFKANVELLSAILKGYTESIFSYEQALKDFSEKYPEGSLHNYAQNLLGAMSSDKENINQLSFEFSEDFKQLHLVSVTFNSSLNDDENIKSFIERFNQENFKNQRLSVGYLQFDESNETGVFFVNSFKTKSAAETYNLALTEAFNDLKCHQPNPNFHSFAISKDNFNMLFQSKKLDNYLAFNKRFYK